MKKIRKYGLALVFMLALFASIWTGRAQHTHSWANCVTDEAPFSYSKQFCHWYNPGSLYCEEWWLYSITDSGVETYTYVQLIYSYGVLVSDYGDNDPFSGLFKICKVNYSWNDGGANDYAVSETGYESVRAKNGCPGGIRLAYRGTGNIIKTTGNREVQQGNIDENYWNTQGNEVYLQPSSRTRSPTLPSQRDYVGYNYFWQMN